MVERFFENLEKNELLIAYTDNKKNIFLVGCEAYDDILSRILGEKNHEWWLYLSKNEIIHEILRHAPIYDAYNNKYPTNILQFIHDYLDHDFICDFLDGYINYDLSENDAILFSEWYKENNITMNDKEKDFYNWLTLPLEERDLDDETLSRWGLE
jgi:hypothetical protein